MLGLDTYENLARSGIDFASLLEKDSDSDEGKDSASKSDVLSPLPLNTHNLVLDIDDAKYLSQSLDTSVFSTSLDRGYLSRQPVHHKHELEGLLQGTKSLDNLDKVTHAKERTRNEANGYVALGGGRDSPTHLKVPGGHVAAFGARSMENLEGEMIEGVVIGSACSLMHDVAATGQEEEEEEVRVFLCVVGIRGEEMGEILNISLFGDKLVRLLKC